MSLGRGIAMFTSAFGIIGMLVMPEIARAFSRKFNSKYPGRAKIYEGKWMIVGLMAGYLVGGMILWFLMSL